MPYPFVIDNFLIVITFSLLLITRFLYIPLGFTLISLDSNYNWGVFCKVFRFILMYRSLFGFFYPTRNS
ncbi:uncharacterized protein Smp_093760.2 [Schistosoma mansoni]|uniref:uncharacterized protein n=1 Tax=Schistosoma mansoni TaxID=6183 RepID=UPI00022DCAF0|nr:uncharacterized protein Smp_093760.2 [Schistosoma mansoni]|eukprot:XP_018654590.1 uncharacterized protein Smp_093760.2 [Schistosoma mansoni]